MAQQRTAPGKNLADRCEAARPRTVWTDHAAVGGASSSESTWMAVADRMVIFCLAIFARPAAYHPLENRTGTRVLGARRAQRDSRTTPHQLVFT